MKTGNLNNSTGELSMPHEVSGKSYGSVDAVNVHQEALHAQFSKPGYKSFWYPSNPRMGVTCIAVVACSWVFLVCNYVVVGFFGESQNVSSVYEPTPRRISQAHLLSGSSVAPLRGVVPKGIAAGLIMGNKARHLKANFLQLSKHRVVEDSEVNSVPVLPANFIWGVGDKVRCIKELKEYNTEGMFSKIMRISTMMRTPAMPGDEGEITARNENTGNVDVKVKNMIYKDVGKKDLQLVEQAWRKDARVRINKDLRKTPDNRSFKYITPSGFTRDGTPTHNPNGKDGKIVKVNDNNTYDVGLDGGGSWLGVPQVFLTRFSSAKASADLRGRKKSKPDMIGPQVSEAEKSEKLKRLNDDIEAAKTLEHAIVRKLFNDNLFNDTVDAEKMRTNLMEEGSDGTRAEDGTLKNKKAWKLHIQDYLAVKGFSLEKHTEMEQWLQKSEPDKKVNKCSKMQMLFLLAKNLYDPMFEDYKKFRDNEPGAENREQKLKAERQMLNKLSEQVKKLRGHYQKAECQKVGTDLPQPAPSQNNNQQGSGGGQVQNNASGGTVHHHHHYNDSGGLDATDVLLLSALMWGPPLLFMPHYPMYGGFFGPPFYGCYMGGYGLGYMGGVSMTEINNTEINNVTNVTNIINEDSGDDSEDAEGTEPPDPAQTSDDINQEDAKAGDATDGEPDGNVGDINAPNDTANAEEPSGDIGDINAPNDTANAEEPPGDIGDINAAQDGENAKPEDTGGIDDGGRAEEPQQEEQEQGNDDSDGGGGEE